MNDNGNGDTLASRIAFAVAPIVAKRIEAERLRQQHKRQKAIIATALAAAVSLTLVASYIHVIRKG